MSDAAVDAVRRSADGTNLAYQVTGDGPLDLVFMPGLAVPVDLMWDDPGLIRIRKRLGAFSRTIWFGRQGLGASEGNPIEIHRRRALRCGPDCRARRGGSRAGRACWDRARAGRMPSASRRAHPERVDALVLCNTYAHYVRDDDYPWGVPVQLAGSVRGAASRHAGALAPTCESLAPSRIADDRFRQWWARNRAARCRPRPKSAT